MRGKTTLLRLIKFFGKAILGLLLTIIALLALIHIPPVQDVIARKLSNYLSTKIETKVEIEKLRFSIFGSVLVGGLTIEGHDAEDILTGREIELSLSTLNLVKGNLIFDDIRLSGISTTLEENERGLNIAFILDAFSTADTTSTPKQRSRPLYFNHILLEDIRFRFSSTINPLSVTADIGKFESEETEFIPNEPRLKAGRIILEKCDITTLIPGDTDTATNEERTSTPKRFTFFDPGIAIDIADLDLVENHISFHNGKGNDPVKFDPDHIDLSDMQLSLADIHVNTDTLAAELRSVAFQLPGFTLSEGSGAIQLLGKQLTLSGLHLASPQSVVDAEITAPLVLQSTKDTLEASVGINTSVRIHPSELAYFLHDSIMHQIAGFGLSELTLEASYKGGKGTITNLGMRTLKTQFTATGRVEDFMNPSSLSWTDVVVDASIGSDTRQFLTPIIGTLSLPDQMKVYLKSRGNLSEFYGNANVVTPWGNATAEGFVARRSDRLNVDGRVSGSKVDLGKWLRLPAVGTVDLVAHAKGRTGEQQKINVTGRIHRIEIQNNVVHDITVRGDAGVEVINATLSVADPEYACDINSRIDLRNSLTLHSEMRFYDFKLGNLLQLDTTLAISGYARANISVDGPSLTAYLEGDSVRLKDQFIDYQLDTVSLQAIISPTISDIRYYTDHAEAHVVTNFDIRDASEVMRERRDAILGARDTDSSSGRTGYARIDLKNANILKLAGVEIDEFSSLRLTGEFDEQKGSTVVRATSGRFRGYGTSLDTLVADFTTLRDSVNIALNVENIVYDSIQLGTLTLDALTKGDTTTSTLRLGTDSLGLLGFRARVLQSDSVTYVFPDSLQAFGRDYSIRWNGPIMIKNRRPVFDSLEVFRDKMNIRVDGDSTALTMDVEHLDLTDLNYFIVQDTTVINSGLLSGQASFRTGQPPEFNAAIDSLVLYNANPLRVTANAASEGNRVPFGFLITDETNTIDLRGDYLPASKVVDASLVVNIINPELFQFMVSDYIEKIKGNIKGNATINGLVQTPAVRGSFRFIDTQITTANPRLTFNIKDDHIAIDNSSIQFDHFTLYDENQRPLTLDGVISSGDYQTITYDLRIDGDDYTLINNADSAGRKLRGKLVVDSDIRLRGDGKDTNVEANVAVKNATNLNFVSSSDDIELLKAEGIVDFVDPTMVSDSAVAQTGTFYDSLIASLPEFNLTSRITIEENAVLGIILDERSGDRIESSGAANLELGYDRTGNIHLSGTYTVARGLYRLSFYDLVKKNFNLVPGSTISWSGSPKSGDLNIQAVHTVESNSIGLIGHEIGENEKSVYKRSLDYKVGININGPIEKPVVSFSLDLPQDDKASYPVLANKLERLQQPEYESELNKQVFGLLVLGGFLPETSGSDINSGVIATTALSNSVNALLASQLNRFASQHVKGVSIDVGIQSYSDYSAPGGKTQTAMDFRVSKSVMDDRLSFEVGGDFDINQDQSGGNTGKNYRGDIAIIYDLTGNGDKQLKLFNNETYDIVYQEIRNTGISLIFIREFAGKAQNQNETK